MASIEVDMMPSKLAHSSAGSRLVHTPAIVNQIIDLISTYDMYPLGTLLSVQQVSHAFLQAARADRPWRVLMSRDFRNYQGAAIPIRLPYASEATQRAVDRITNETTTHAWQLYKQRKRLNQIALTLVAYLVEIPHHKLTVFSTLVALGPQVVDGIDLYTTQIPYEHGSHWLNQHWWSTEVIAAIFRVDACKRWRAINEGESIGVTGAARASAYEDALASLAWIGHGCRVPVLAQLELLARDTDSFVRSHMTKGPETEESLFQLRVLELVRGRLILAGYVFPHDGKEENLPLSLLLPNLVMQAASTRNEEVDFVLQLQHIMAGRPDRNRSIQEVLTPVLQRHPTCSLAIFATLFCAVARRLSSPYRITCEPSNDPKFVELVVSSDSILSFDLVRGGLKVTTQDEIEKLPTRSRPLSPCVMLHRFIDQLDQATSSDSAADPYVDIVLAINYAVPLVRALVTQSFPQREAAIRSSLGATKLAPILAYCYPLDVLTILEQEVKPMLADGKDHVKRVVNSVIDYAIEQDRNSAPKRREGLNLRFKVGALVSPTDEGDWVGIVVGWDVEWNLSAAKYTLEGISGSAFKNASTGPFYMIVSPDHPVAYHASHYLPESKLMYARTDSMDENMSKLLHVPMFSRYFGAVAQTTEGAIHITPSSELLARYPDDFDVRPGENDDDDDTGDDGVDNDDDERSEGSNGEDASEQEEAQSMWRKLSEVLRVN